MSSDSEVIVQKKKRVMLDSDEEERIANEKKEREAEKQRKRLEKEAKQREIEEKRKLEKQQEKEKRKKALESMDFSILLEPDSNSHTSFTKIRANIKEKYPKLNNPYEKGSEKKEKHKQHKQHKEHKEHKQSKNKQRKERQRERSPVRREERSERPSRISQTKQDTKQQILYEIISRWWYISPNWLPQDIDYESILKEKGYILLSPDAFRKSPQIVNGLKKVQQAGNYPGVFRRKGQLIDLRPKQNIPSVDNYSQKSITQLVDLLKIALKNQIKDLEQVLQSSQSKPKAQNDLLDNLKMRLATISN